MNETKPLLSIGMIFRDDIRCLERCLKSLQPLRDAVPCELVMADTGSVDGSREVAEQYADILIDFPWVNDFSAARNAVLDRCSGTWNLTIDSDEWLEDIQPLLDFLREPEEQKADLALVTQFNYKNMEDKTQYIAFFAAGRLARFREGLLRYTGKIHETLRYNGKPLRAQRRPEIVLYHDGYIYVNAEAQRAKSERNMTLLRRVIREHPYDLRTLIHCIQSAYDSGERMKYAKRTMRALQDRRTQGDIRRSTAYQNAVWAAYQSGEPDLVLDWLAEGLAEFPQSLLLRVDSCYLAMQVKYDREDFAGALEYEGLWREALEEYRENKDELNELELGGLSCADEYHVSHCLALLTLCAIWAEKWALAQKLLDEQADRRPTRKSNLLQLLLETVLSYTGQVDARAYLQAQWDQALEGLKSEDEAEAKFADQCVDMMLNAMGTALHSDQRARALETLASLGDRDPAHSARILLSQDPEAMRYELAGARRWDHIFVPAVLHMMERGVPLTENFFQMPCELMVKYATLMSRLAEHFSTLVLKYAEAEDTESSLPRCLWAVVLTAAALRKGKWEEGEGAALCTLFASLEAGYLGSLCRLDALEESDLPALPALHRFGWRLLQGIEALKQGNASEYARLIREGVKDTPDMANAAAVLCDHPELLAPDPAPAPELLALAEQVKAILSQHDPDDPAVAALKASPVYQKVAYLLEEAPIVTAQAVTEPELSPAPIPASQRSSALLDRQFSALVEWCASMKEEKLFYHLKKGFLKLPKQHQQLLTDYLNTYPLWGSFRPERGDFGVLAEKARSLTAHAADYTWLYGRLEDFRSRKLLYAILSNWTRFDLKALGECKDSCFDDYFDLDVFPCGPGEVVADLGAYIGDTAVSFVNTYGPDAYRRYYCYEISPDSMEQLKQNTAKLPNLIYRQKGAGERAGTMSVQLGSDASANALTQGGDIQVEVAALDEDITEPITVLKMDIEGAEQAAIRGAARHIRDDRPKMALSVYHNNEDLWKIPRMIDELCPGCRFYLRYHGENLWPTEISFLAVPDKS